MVSLFCTKHKSCLKESSILISTFKTTGGIIVSYKRIIFVPETTASYIREILTLNPEELFSKYGALQGVVFRQKIVFTKDVSVELKISLNSNGEPSVDGYLKEKCDLWKDIENVPCVEGSADFFGDWKFFHGGVEYGVQMVT